MYESPIDKIVGEIESQMIQEEENRILYHVKQSVGYNVDKDELIRALNYDRNQYEKGYKDGLNSDKWIPASERLPKEDEYVGEVRKYYLVQDEYGDMHVAHYSRVGWMPLDSPLKALGDEIVAWQELPIPYRNKEGKEIEYE